jgi:sugar phosphate permease
LIIGVGCFASFLTYIHRYAWGVTRPDLRQEYNLSPEDMGWLDAGFNLTYAFGQAPGGWAGDILGPRLVIPLAAILWTLAMVGPALTGRFWPLLGLRLAFGAAQAPCYPNLGKLTKSWAPLSVRTSVQGLVASFSGRAGGAMAPPLIGIVLMTWLGFSWQMSLYALAGSGFVFALLFWAVFRNHPADHSWSNDAERALIEHGEPPAKDATRIHWTPAGVRNLVVFMGASFCSTFADNFFVIYMSTFLIEEKSFTKAEMGAYAGLPIWGGAIGGVCGGVLNDLLIRYTGNPRFARSAVAATGKIIAAILIAGSLMLQDGRLVMFVLFTCKFFSDWSQPTWWGTVTDIGGPVAGRVFGMVNMVGSIGATVASVAMAQVLGGYGWTALFLFVGGMYILTAAFWCFVNCQRRLYK